MDWRIESGERLYRAKAYAHFSGGMGDTVRTRLGMKRYDNGFDENTIEETRARSAATRIRAWSGRRRRHGSARPRRGSAFARHPAGRPDRTRDRATPWL